MNKGIVMEQHQHYTIVMTNDGLFQKALPIKDAAIGTEVYYRPLVVKETNSFIFNLRRFVTVPAGILTMVCLIILIAIPMYFKVDASKTYAYINVDINPSVEIELNKEMQVNSISPLNADASILVKHLTDLKGEKVGTVLKKLMQESEASGLTKNGKNMIIGISYVDAQNKETFNFDKLNLSPDWGVVTLNISEDIRKMAEKKQISMNKIMIEAVNENPEKISHLNSRAKEIIYSFYNRKHQEERNEQDSSQLKKNEQQNKKSESKSGKASDHSSEKATNKLKDNSKKESKEKSNQTKRKEKHPHQQNKNKKYTPPSQEKKHKQHHPPGQQKKEKKHKQHHPPGQQKKEKKHKQHHPPGQQKKEKKHKQHHPPGQQKKEKQHQPPGHQKNKDGLPPGQQKHQK